MANTTYPIEKRLGIGCVLNPNWVWDEQQKTAYLTYINQIAFQCRLAGRANIVSIICPEGFDRSAVAGILTEQIEFREMPERYFKAEDMNQLLTSSVLYKAYCDFMYFLCISPNIIIRNVYALLASLDYTLATKPIVYDWFGSINAQGDNVYFRRCEKCVEICDKYGESEEGDLSYFLITHVNDIVRLQS